MFTTIMTLGTPQRVTLQQLRVETFPPADKESEACWPRLLANLNTEAEPGPKTS